MNQPYYVDQYDEEGRDDSLPAYLVSANNHNIANKNQELIDRQAQRTYGQRIYNMIGSAAISGINSFRNTAEWASNWFSDEGANYTDTRDVIASFDEDMAMYYDDNRQAADIVGLVATSLVPGLGGIKVLNAGTKALSMAKGGQITANVSKGLGILPNSRNLLVKEASELFASSSLPFSYRNPAVMKAISAGFGQAALESLAFETAVAITMKKNPILTDLDFGQTLSNMAMGTIYGTGIGGALYGVGATWRIKKGIKTVDQLIHRAGGRQINTGMAGTHEADQILLMRNDLDIMARNAPEGVSQHHYDRLVEDKIRNVDNLSRENMTKLAGGDAEIGQLMWNGIAGDTSTELNSKLLGLAGFRPIEALDKWVSKNKWSITDTTPPVPKDHKRVWYTEGAAETSTLRNAEHTHFLDVPVGTQDITAAGGTPIGSPSHTVRYLKLWGEGMGRLSEEAPAAKHLADFGKVTVKRGVVQFGDGSYKIKPGARVDVTQLSYEEALARNIWAMDDTVPRLVEMMPKKGPRLIDIHANDIPMLTKAYREGFTAFRIVGDNGELIASHLDRSELLEYLTTRKGQLAQERMLKVASGELDETVEHVANRLDTPLGFITGEEVAANTELAVFGLKAAQSKFFEKFHANTPRPPAQETVKPWLKPQNFGLVYDNAKAHSINGFEIDAMAEIAARQQILKAKSENAAAQVLGDLYELIPDITPEHMTGITRTGAGPGFVTFQDASYGSLEGLFAYVGTQATLAMRRAADSIGNVFTASNYALLNKPEAALEWATIMQKTRAAGNHRYVLSESGEELVLKSVRDFERKVSEGLVESAPNIPSWIDERIPIQHPEVSRWIDTHLQVNAKRVHGRNTLDSAQGYDSNWDPEIFYPPAPNPDRFKHHAFVVDDTKAVSQGDTTMLYAVDAQSLEKQIAEARAQGFQVYTPQQTAEYYRARGMFDYSLSLSEAQMDVGLRATGSSAPAFPLTGSPEEMLQDAMQWHAKQETGLIRHAIKTKFSQEFGIIGRLAKEYDSAAQSQIGLDKILNKEHKNPYRDYLKLALGESRKGEYPVWETLNDFVEKVGDKVWGGISNVWRSSKTFGDLEIDQINKLLKDYGMDMAATKPQLEAWVNHPAGKQHITKFVQTQQAILSTLLLRMDPIHALNNAISSPILTITETGSVLRHMAEGRFDLVGQLATKLPGVDDTIRTPGKLVAKGYANFFSPAKDELLARYRKMGVVTDLSTQIKHLMEVATIKGTETASELEAKRQLLIAKATKLVDLGERGTGNRVAEELNRFVSANVMDQILEPFVQANLISEKESYAFISTFVNRTQGNLIASQRPQMFQGPIGMAMGLFQSYQFNIMQNLLRHIGEGSKKDALTLMGLQGTVFGMNGLPGFKAINQHIIGTASGNTEHVDAYSSVNNIVGHEIGDWLMYGASSHMLLDPDLKINLYTRGDINPRSVTVVPTSFSDIPVVNAYAGLYRAIKETVGNLANGGDVWNSLLGGLERQGVMRPLAGAARVARGLANDGVSYSTTGRGNIISANDFYSLANLARLSGARPLHEAVAQDAMFRWQGYAAKDTAMRASLGKAIRTIIVGGGEPTEEQMLEFMESYAKSGGKHEEFSKWYVQQVRTATTPQVNTMMKNMDSPQAKYLQSIMGGRMLKSADDVRMEREQQLE